MIVFLLFRRADRYESEESRIEDSSRNALDLSKELTNPRDLPPPCPRSLRNADMSFTENDLLNPDPSEHAVVGGKAFPPGDHLRINAVSTEYPKEFRTNHSRQLVGWEMNFSKEDAERKRRISSRRTLSSLRHGSETAGNHPHQLAPRISRCSGA